MYIWDALYGKMEFSPLVYKCMLSPEMQRLREVRLCNINSLFITGSSNSNRFEHSVGTAYLAQLCINKAMQGDEMREIFVLSALLHDVANGPFGHSYEYIMEKTGFVPEKGLESLLSDITTTGNDTHANTSPFEAFYFGTTKSLTNILNENQKDEISKIISGNHELSKLISDSIDLDNIDNVFRMAYHMGLSFSREAPIKLACMMYLNNGQVYFDKAAKPFLDEWFSVRRRVYKFLLLNPQEFAGKYMLTEAMDILFECIAQKKAGDREIKWYYTDYQLLEELYLLKEKWLKRRTLLLEGIDCCKVNNIIKKNSEDEKRFEIKEYIESLNTTVPIKEKGKQGQSHKLLLSDNFSFRVENNAIFIKNRGAEFEIESDKLYKVVNIQYNAAQIISRLMTGDLYRCLLILESTQIHKYSEFLDYSKRIIIEDALESAIRINKGFSSINIGIHPILDVNKTERQLKIRFDGDKSPSVIGDCASKKLLIGVFIKNEPFGLRQSKAATEKKLGKLADIVFDYFSSYFNNDVKKVSLYKEAEQYGY